MIEKLRKIFEMIVGIIFVLIIAAFVFYPIYDGVKWYVFESKEITGRHDPFPLNAGRAWCDYQYHGMKIPFEELSENCQWQKSIKKDGVIIGRTEQ
jgi:hypothetical protein